jgi:hypothetical protein
MTWHLFESIGVFFEPMNNFLNPLKLSVQRENKLNIIF